MAAHRTIASARSSAVHRVARARPRGNAVTLFKILANRLARVGLVEGRNLKIVAFWATGREDMEGVAHWVLASDPDVVVTQELMAIAMRNLQSAKPVVFGFSGDPVDGKLVQSWARPAGNFTGMSYLAIELVGKRIELLKK